MATGPPTQTLAGGGTFQEEKCPFGAAVCGALLAPPCVQGAGREGQDQGPLWQDHLRVIFYNSSYYIQKGSFKSGGIFKAGLVEEGEEVEEVEDEDDEEPEPEDVAPAPAAPAAHQGTSGAPCA